MRQFNEYLSIKINLSNKFPEEPNLQRIILFLRRQGFKELEFDDKIYYAHILKENSDSKRFMCHETGTLNQKRNWIRFIGTGNVCEGNPSFYIGFNNDKLDYMSVEFSLPSKKEDKYDNYEDFVETVNSFFNWE